MDILRYEVSRPTGIPFHVGPAEVGTATNHRSEIGRHAWTGHGTATGHRSRMEDRGRTGYRRRTDDRGGTAHGRHPGSHRMAGRGGIP